METVKPETTLLSQQASGALEALSHYALDEGLDDLHRLLLDVADFAKDSARWIATGNTAHTRKGPTAFYVNLCKASGLPVPKIQRSWDREHPRLFRNLGKPSDE